MFRIPLILLLSFNSIDAQRLDLSARAILASNPRVHWGIHAVQLKTGRVLFTHNADQFFVPASNAKLFSTAFALTALGAEHRFSTRVLSTAEPDAQGTVAGDLILLGGGDPSLSSRRYPYDRAQPFAENRLSPLRELARQLKDRGVLYIAGSIVGDDSLYEFKPVPNGWSADDGVFEYGAPVSALTFNDNSFSLRAGAAGISIEPPVEYFTILNEIRSDAALDRRVIADRQPGSRVIRLSGNLPPAAKEYTNEFAVEDPALYAAISFRQVLIEEGIRVDGSAAARHLAPSAPETVELARRDSPPLQQLLQVVDKESQNLHAELMLRAAKQKMPMAGFLQLAGIDEKDLNLEDGSGMSRLNLICPRAVVKLLSFIAARGQLELFRDFLPTGTEDGTLRNRFSKSAQGKLIRAKTGTLSHVAALGGYAESKRYGTIAFQIVANNFNAPSQEVRAAIDRIALALLQ